MIEFRRGLRDALDRGAPDAVRLIQDTGTLDDARKQALRGDAQTIRSDHHTSARAAEGRSEGEPAMTERLADITARIDGIRQLGTVVNAMRGIAAARAQQARSQLVAVDGYAATIAAAIGRALALSPFDRRRRRAKIDPAGAGAVLRRAGICRRLQRARAGCGRRRSRHVRIVPDRDAGQRRGRRKGRRSRPGKAPCRRIRSASPSSPTASPKRSTPVSPTGRSTGSTSSSANGSPATASHVERRRLFPLDMTRFRNRRTPTRRSLNLAPEALLSELTADYLHAQLCNAALHAFAAENEARMEAMAAARNQIERQLSALQATQRHVRQEEITAEIIELAAGETASRTDR